MNITLAENSGFCTGVRRADKFINALIAENDGKIFTQKEIGLRIRSYRKEKGLSQTQLAEKIGKSLRV